jgi:polyhydroxyalkanoate synthesis regulator phasin
MKKSKLIAASVIAGAALTLGSVTGAVAHDRKGDRGAGLTTILGGLVTKGTLTQAQVDAITKAMDDLRAAGKAAHDAARAAHIKVITDTLGITEADLTARMKAGESLATIAGAKKDALIAALVAFHTKQIDEAVTAGKMTADQATKLKANLKDRVTAGVERAKGDHVGFGHKGGKGRGHGPRA